jgi:hypothetical protein
MVRSKLILSAVCLTLSAAPVFAREKCIVTDPTGTPLNIRDLNMSITSTIGNGESVFIDRYGKDAHGKPWVFILGPNGDQLGWVYRRYLTCS